MAVDVSDEPLILIDQRWLIDVVHVCVPGNPLQARPDAPMIPLHRLPRSAYDTACVTERKNSALGH